MTLEKKFVDLIKTKNKLKFFEIKEELNCSCEWAFNAVKRLIDARFAKVLCDNIEFYVENVSGVELRILLEDESTRYGEGRIEFLGRTLTTIDITNLEYIVFQYSIYQTAIKTDKLLSLPCLKGAINSLKNLISYQLVIFENGFFTPTLDMQIFYKIKAVYDEKLKFIQEFYDKYVKQKLTSNNFGFENFLTYYWYEIEYQALATKEDIIEYPYDEIKLQPLESDKEYLKLVKKKNRTSVSLPYSYSSFLQKVESFGKRFLKNNKAIDIVLVNDFGGTFHMIIDPQITVVEIFTQAVKSGATAEFFIGKKLSKMEFVEYVLDKCVYFEPEDSFSTIPITGETKFSKLLDFDVIMALMNGRPLRIKVWIS